MRRSFKVVLWLFISLLVLLLVCAAVAPSLLSTRWGTDKAVSLFNSYSSGTLSIDKLHLSWFGKQKLENLLYLDKNDEKMVSIPSFETKTSLFYLLFGGRTLGNTDLVEPYFLIKAEEKEDSKPSKKKKKSSKKRVVIPTQFENKLTVTNGTIIIRSPKTSPIVLSEIEVETQQNPSVYHIHARTEEGEVRGKLEVDVSLKEKMEIVGKIDHFPVEILDQIAQSDLFTDALGRTLNLSFDFIKELDGTLSVAGQIDATNLKGQLEGVTRDQKLYLTPGSHLTYTLTPKFFRFLLPESQKEEWSLASPTEVSLEIEKGIFPLHLKKPDFHEIVFQAKGAVQRAEINHKTLSGYSLNHFSFDVIAQDNLEIAYKGEIQGKEASKLSGTLSITPQGDLYFQSDYKGFPVSLLQLISPATEETIRRLFGSSFDLVSEGIYKEGAIEAQFTLLAPGFTVNGTVSGEPSDLNFDLTGTRTLTGTAAQYLGTKVDFQFDGLAQISEEGASVPTLNGQLSTPYYVADVTGTIGERGQKLDINEVELIAKGEVRALPFGDQFPEATLNNGSFYVNVDGPSNKISGKAAVMIDSKKSQTEFEITDFIRQDAVDLANANYFFDSQLNGFPLLVLNPLMPDVVDLPSLFGTFADIDAKGSYTPTQDPRGLIDVKAKAEGLEASFSLSVDGTLSVAQNQRSFIRWQLTPERYHSLITRLRPDHTPVFQLTEPAMVQLSIKELTCPTSEIEGVSQFLCQSGFVGELKLGTLSFLNEQTQEYLVVHDVIGSIEGVNFSEAIELFMSGKLFAQNIPESQKSAFEFKGKMLNFWLPEGKFNREGLTLDGELSLELIPVKQITEIFTMDPESRALVQAVLGELVNARIYGTISQLAGPLTIDIKASNFKATLPITLHPNAIYLRDAVDAEITLTEAVNHTLIRDINPLIIAGAYSEHPVRLHLDPQGFMIPIRPYSLQGVRIDQAIIDIGQIQVRNGGDIQLLMNFLKAKEISPEGDMNAWFTPIYMSLNNGVASYKRFDALLANKVHIAMWGSVNLINNQVSMTMGIAPNTLYEYFKISGVPKQDMFQVKMRGTTDKLDLDWSAATKRIGVIIARSTAGPLGGLVGGILEGVLNMFGDEPAPPPTTSPFPWEK